jgi:hypothetical protein
MQFLIRNALCAEFRLAESMQGNSERVILSNSISYKCEDFKNNGYQAKFCHPCS